MLTVLSKQLSVLLQLIKDPFGKSRGSTVGKIWPGVVWFKYCPKPHKTIEHTSALNFQKYFSLLFLPKNLSLLFYLKKTPDEKINWNVEKNGNSWFTYVHFFFNSHNWSPYEISTHHYTVYVLSDSR